MTGVIDWTNECPISMQVSQHLARHIWNSRMPNEQLRDELDKLQIEQLHQVVLRLSANSFEIKKLCITVIVSASVLVASFTDRQLDSSIFLAAAIIIAFFYMLDVQVYYYQQKIRIRMKVINDRMMQRHFSSVDTEGVGMPFTEQRSQFRRLWHAFFNASMWPYAALVSVDIILFVLYLLG